MRLTGGADRRAAHLSAMHTVSLGSQSILHNAEGRPKPPFQYCRSFLGYQVLAALQPPLEASPVQLCEITPAALVIVNVSVVFGDVAVTE
jgi:hypothetical protein